MVAGYTPDTISSIIDSLCIVTWKEPMHENHSDNSICIQRVTGYSHIDIVFSLSQKTFLKSGNFLSIIICFELQTFAGFHFPTYSIIYISCIWGFEVS